jgi:hypothetical protein
MSSTRILLAVAAACVVSVIITIQTMSNFQQMFICSPLSSIASIGADFRNKLLNTDASGSKNVALGMACRDRQAKRPDDWEYFLNEIVMHKQVYTTVNATDYVPNLVGWTNARALYDKYLPELVNARAGKQAKIVGVELGTWAGKSAFEMAAVMKRYCSDSCLLLAVDTWLGDPAMISSFPSHPLVIEMKKTGRLRVFDAFLKNMIASNVSDLVVPVRQPADMAASLLRCMRLTVDVVWMDTYQEYKFVREMINYWWPLLRPGGFFFGSDYANNFPGVVQAANDFVKENNLTFLDNSLNTEVWVVRKP